MEMKQKDSQTETPYEIDAKWALSMQPFAVSQFYNKLWQGANIIELDTMTANELARIIDIGGADKMIRYQDGGLAFLGQRFRRPRYLKYDDFTIVISRPAGGVSELAKIHLALRRGGFIASFYAYGHVNEQQDGFARMRILKFQEFIKSVLDGEIGSGFGYNPDGNRWLKVPFDSIPSKFFLLNHAEDKTQQARLL